MAKSFELVCTDGRASFYGKAVVLDEGTTLTLLSYGTKVAKITENPYGQRTFERLWSGYSATTMRHVNAFIDLYGISGGGKSWWDAQKVS